MVPLILRSGWRDSLPQVWWGLFYFCVSTTFAARGWLTWQADSPIRGLFWQEGWWSPLLQSVGGISWESWAKQSDPYITTLLSVMGGGLIVLSLLPWLLSRFPGLRGVLLLGAGVLLLDSFARWVASDFEVGMGIEHALQVVAPVALFFAEKGRALPVSEKRETGVLWLFLIATIGTFVGHGCYAAGLHPVPLAYRTMTMKLLGVEDGTALLFLRGVGGLDFLFSLLLLFPQVRSIGLYWCVGWGLLTALARVVSYFDWSAPGWNLDPWLFETLVRTPHWLLPGLALGMGWKRHSDLRADHEVQK